MTVAAEARVNPNTVSREVLLAVLDDAATVERLLAARARAPIDPAARTRMRTSPAPSEGRSVSS